jgi:hypothetical protein
MAMMFDLVIGCAPVLIDSARFGDRAAVNPHERRSEVIASRRALT